ncbi:DoxX-like family protein [Paenibacillus chitinolyticus]|uniref:DoxX-like family protein n=1 Tax=Paenibacillus chitinolyticus TaxID=79263 RepID=UPI0036D91999
MAAKPIYVELDIQTDMETLWKATQTPELHQQWDLRFTEITYLPRSGDREPQRFHYRTRIGFGMNIAGTGETKAKTNLLTGERISGLKFGSPQRISLIRSGNGYWKYSPKGGSVTFATRYTYDTRFGGAGRLFDRCLFRPLFGYATAWSFDMLRIWLEKGIPPSVSIQRALMHYFSAGLLALLWVYQGLVPKLLFPGGGELAILQAAGWFPGGEKPALALLGAGEIGIGLLAAAHRQAGAYIVQAALLLLLPAIALARSPELLQAPFNPLTLSGAMAGLCLLAFWSRRELPRAGRCLRKPRGGGKEEAPKWHPYTSGR